MALPSRVSSTFRRRYVREPRGEIGARAGPSGRRVRLNRRLGWALTALREPRGELGARADLELAVDLREVPLHGLRADEERVRDLAIGASGGHERRDPLLGRRQRSGRGGPPADAAQLGSCTLGPEPRAEVLEDLAGLCQRLPRDAPLPAPPLQRSQDEERAPALERLLEAIVQLERGVELRECAVDVAARRRDESPAAARHDLRPDA